MRILWFTNTSSLYDQGTHRYFGGGWIESLEKLIQQESDIDLAVSFFHNSDGQKVRKNKTTYYPIKRKVRNSLKKLINNWSAERISVKNYEQSILKVINDFKPDVIQVFGSEGIFGIVQDLTEIPVVVHIQGLINPCLNTYYPINHSEIDFILDKSFLLNNIMGNSPAFGRKEFKVRAEREKELLSKVRYVMGRTHWDKKITSIYNPDIEYFHLDEVLRPEFYEVKINKEKNNELLKITSVLSPTVYKGIDVLLKTADKLKELTDLKFRWNVIGISENDIFLKHFEKKLKTNHRKLNVTCYGRNKPNDMIDILLDTDLFIHPTYIDNSPNSICEAQMLGLPVIACDVGGISTLVKHNENGFLVPSNGVFEFVYYINKISNNVEMSTTLGSNARKHALKRHDRERIKKELIEIYKSICRS